jgi:hypothetical protein
MSTKMSATASSVLSTIAKTWTASNMACGDFIPTVNNFTITSNSSAQQPVYTSGYIAPVTSTEYTITTTTTEANGNGYTFIAPNVQLNWQPGTPGIQTTVPNDNTYYPDISSGGMPYIGDPVPNTGGFIFPPMNPNPNPFIPNPTPFKIEPNLEDLEEGLHDIPGGKIFIKKIKITEEQLDDAIQEALGHEASPEEKAAIVKEIEELAASEEREV